MNSENMRWSYRIQLWFLRRFILFRLTECNNERLEVRCEEYEKKSKSDTELIDVMRRHIKTLEDIDKERVAQIAELETQCRELREHLSGLLPSK